MQGTGCLQTHLEGLEEWVLDWKEAQNNTTELTCQRSCCLCHSQEGGESGTTEFKKMLSS